VTTTPQARTERFAFGSNWSDFLGEVDEERIRIAEESVRRLLGAADLEGRSFLDVGCGSGLFSLAAARLGAERVHSFDFDPDSVRTTERLRDRYLPATKWAVERGDALDAGYLDGLGAFDVVYAWGVLHHTGAMWRAIENVAGTVREGGLFALAIYNDQGRLSTYWRAVKRLYNRLPRRLQAAYALLVMLPVELRLILGALARRDPASYVHGWTRSLDRGMSRWHDMLDWVGGYPFEVASPGEVFHFLSDRGFALRGVSTVGGSAGCNEFVFDRSVDGSDK